MGMKVFNPTARNDKRPREQRPFAGDPRPLRHLHHLEEPHRRLLHRRRPFNRLPLVIQRHLTPHDRAHHTHPSFRNPLLTGMA